MDSYTHKLKPKCQISPKIENAHCCPVTSGEDDDDEFKYEQKIDKYPRVGMEKDVATTLTNQFATNATLSEVHAPLKGINITFPLGGS